MVANGMQSRGKKERKRKILVVTSFLKLETKPQLGS